MWHEICERISLTKKQEDNFKQRYLSAVVCEIENSNLSETTKAFLIQSINYAEKGKR